MCCTSADLHVAIYSSNMNVIKQCVKRKDILDSYWRGCTPILSAVYLKRYSILKKLVKNGADVNLRSKNNKMEPALFAACRLRDIQALNILLCSPSIDIDQCDFFGRTALWAAANYGTVDIVELLLNNGADLNTNISIKHPITGAMNQNWPTARNIIHCLLRRGSILSADTQESLLKKAVAYADRETFCLLVSAGCKVNCYRNWLSFDHLPEVWQKDESFCNWIALLNGSPSSLLNLTICCIRNLLIEKWHVLSSQNIEKLELPNSLSNLLLLHT